jgi:1-deoxy-D-xylulose-5-phosphate reductoisomerase
MSAAATASSAPMKNVVVLGSTGSIGRRTLEVIAAGRERFRAFALSAHTKLSLLVEQARRFRPEFVVATDRAAAEAFDWSDLPTETRRLVGHDGVEHVAQHAEVQLVVAAMMGSAGLRGTWAALESGKTVALANKETLVMAGQLAVPLAARSGATLLPIDSEHSAVYQLIDGGRRNDVHRVVLTASGGPFRTRPLEELRSVTVNEALAHPTWDMGPKITVDSATMMNKALEIIEARWLFGLPAEQIGVVIHPQSLVHALVEFVDGSIVAQISPPDMKLPIQFALDYPTRREGISRRLDWASCLAFEFEPPDLERFPALELGMEVARAGGTSGAVLNAANEAAVAGFLDGRIQFVDIVRVCRDVLQVHDHEHQPTLERLYDLDCWARQEVNRWIK